MLPLLDGGGRVRSRMSPRCRQLSWDNRRSAFGVTGRDEDLVVRQVASGEPEDTRGQPLGREIWWGVRPGHPDVVNR